MTTAGAAPRVSVVMAVYNGGADVETTIASILSQQGCVFEVIVIDDGSTDGSAQALARMSAADSRIRLLRQENQGLTRALIRGCELATGEYIARQDCGDRSYPGRLARLAAILDSDSHVVFVASAYRHIGPNGELLGSVSRSDSDQRIRELLTTGDPESLYGPHHGTVMFRRSAYVSAGGYRPEFYFAQDLDLWTRMAALGGFAYIDEQLYEVKFSHGSITATQRSRQQDLRVLIAEAARLRSEGQSDAEVLDRARQVRPNAARPASESEADADYFLGSCLADRRDPAARRYLLRALRRRPWMPKAWAKLVLSVLPQR